MVYGAPYIRDIPCIRTLGEGILSRARARMVQAAGYTDVISYLEIVELRFNRSFLRVWTVWLTLRELQPTTPGTSNTTAPVILDIRQGNIQIQDLLKVLISGTLRMTVLRTTVYRYLQ